MVINSFHPAQKVEVSGKFSKLQQSKGQGEGDAVVVNSTPEKPEEHLEFSDKMKKKLLNIAGHVVAPAMGATVFAAGGALKGFGVACATSLATSIGGPVAGAVMTLFLTAGSVAKDLALSVTGHAPAKGALWTALGHGAETAFAGACGMNHDLATPALVVGGKYAIEGGLYGLKRGVEETDKIIASLPPSSD